MKELKTITECQLLYFAYYSLLERISHEEEINERTKKECGRDNCICQSRLKMYNEQLEEVRERILEIENNNAE
jgi:hypothetical protein